MEHRRTTAALTTSPHGLANDVSITTHTPSTHTHTSYHRNPFTTMHLLHRNLPSAHQPTHMTVSPPGLHVVKTGRAKKSSEHRSFLLVSLELLVEFKSACLVLTRPRRAAPRKLCGFHAKFLGSGGVL